MDKKKGKAPRERATPVKAPDSLAAPVVGRLTVYAANLPQGRVEVSVWDYLDGRPRQIIPVVQESMYATMYPDRVCIGPEEEAKKWVIVTAAYEAVRKRLEEEEKEHA